MKFDRRGAEKELAKLASEMEFMIDESKYPQLYKMEFRGGDHNMNDYFAERDKPIFGQTAEELTAGLTIKGKGKGNE